MALFEFDEGHLVPAQFGRPVANGLGDDVLDAVRAQVLEIVSRPLFPITWRDMSRVADPSNSSPRLTALDAAGQVVSVEVVAHLDSDTLISSLSRLADTAALSWTDLAGEYPGGIDGFKAGWVQFRDSMPPSPASGPRLVMVVGSIDPQVRPALDVLASSGVEVHELSVRQMSNGRVFLEVQAVGPRLYGHVPQVLLGRSTRIDELTGMAQDAGELPGPAESEHVEDVHGRHAGSEASKDWADTEALFEESLVGGVPEPAGGPSAAVEPPDEGGPESELGGETESATVGEPEAPVVPAPGFPVPADAETGPDALVDGAPVGATGPHWSAVHPWQGETVPADATLVDAASYSSVDVAATRVDAEPGVPLLARDREGLQALAQIVGEETPLALRPSLVSSGDSGAALTADGTVRLAHGEYSDPSAALNVAGHPGLDGWEEWRLGDDKGPTLAESLDEVNREIAREYSSPEARRAGRSARHH